MTWSSEITDWQEQTFGTPTAEDAFRRYLVELNELCGGVMDDDAIDALTDGMLTTLVYKGGQHAAEEAADQAITLARFAECLGFDLSLEVDRKMQINRARRWRRHGDGTGQHE